MNASIAIHVEHLHKAYGDVRAVDDLSFSVYRGEIFGLLGPNGAGKTTTLGLLQGLRRADAGRVTVLGQDLAAHAQAVKRRIGVQLQLRNVGQLPHLGGFSGADHGRACARHHGAPASLNSGRLIWSFTDVKVTSTGSSSCNKAGSHGVPTMLVSIFGPSSSFTTAIV